MLYLNNVQDMHIIISFLKKLQEANIEIPTRVWISIKVPIPPKWINPELRDKIVLLEELLVEQGLISIGSTSLLESLSGESYDRIPWYGSTTFLVELWTNLLVDSGLFRNDSAFLVDIKKRFIDARSGKPYKRKVLGQARDKGCSSSSYEDLTRRIEKLFE